MAGIPNKIIFTTLAVPGKSADSAIMMAMSLRKFGGGLSDCPIWVTVPKSKYLFSDSRIEEFSNLGMVIIPFEIEPELANFPFALKVIAAGVAEEKARAAAELITWLDSDTIIIQEPTEFVLSEGKMLGYRPVHHKLIGLGWDEPIDSFWSLIFKLTNASLDKQYKMMTHTGEFIWPYINAGTFVVRPDKKLLSSWSDTFLKNFQDPRLTIFYKKDSRYTIFIHQAIFTGMLLGTLDSDEMYELSPKVNYPLHLHHEVPEELRSGNIDELITIRTENIFEKSDWHEGLPITESLKDWLEKVAYKNPSN